ncbi:MAG TPA: flagellar motor protein [Acidobacteriaceae bacterium]
MKASALGGILLAVGGIAAGLYFDGGHIAQMLQPTAALIVFGGTLGAVIIQFPFATVMRAVGELREVFWGRDDQAAQLIADLTRYTLRARRNGIISLDSELERIGNPFLQKCLTYAVDGVRSDDLRQTMDLVMEEEASREDALSAVFQAAGGFAPTIGILGAVIGLIQVMQKLENINEVGKGIAVAFVATIYGVGAANLFFLPCAGRIKAVMHRRQVMRELMLEGVIGIVDNTNPRALEKKLSAYLHEPRHAPVATLVGK